MKVVAYIDPVAGGLSVLYPSYNDRARPSGETDDECLTRWAAKAIPDGVTTHIIEHTDLPSDRYFRNAWTWSD